MSFEGYYQFFCEHGHCYSGPAGMYYDDEDRSCPDCGTEPVIQNLVDDTNCNSYGIIPDFVLDTLLMRPARSETCPTCSHCREVSPAVYRVPTPEELVTLRHYRDQESADSEPVYKRVLVA